MADTNTSKPTALKACPWCGTAATVTEYTGGLVGVACPKDNCVEGLAVGEPDEAAAEWNTRPVEDALVEALEKSALALSEAAVLLTSKGLGGCGSIMEGHAGIARAALAKVQP